MLNSKNRPLSPHLSVYKIQETSLYSIFQRITGIVIFILLIYTHIGSIFFYNHYSLSVINLLYLYIYFYYLIYSFYLLVFLLTIYHITKGLFTLFFDTII